MSPIGQLNKENLIKIAKFLGLCVLGALLSGAEQLVTQIDFGQYTQIVLFIVNSGILKAAHEWISDEEGKITIGSYKI